MSASAIDRAVKKQRLLQESARLRDEFGGHARGLEPACLRMDEVATGWRWLKANPWLPVAAGVALAVSRPGWVWRWGRRAWAGLQVWRTWSARARFLAEWPRRPIQK